MRFPSAFIDQDDKSMVFEMLDHDLTVPKRRVVPRVNVQNSLDRRRSSNYMRETG